MLFVLAGTRSRSIRRSVRRRPLGHVFLRADGTARNDGVPVASLDEAGVCAVLGVLGTGECRECKGGFFGGAGGRASCGRLAVHFDACG